jgi:tripartite-type tricarboxylate transporter receptor subunit TctC
MRKSVLAALIALLLFGASAHAETFPSRPLTIVVPFAAGGPSDVMARILAERMKTSLGETVLVEDVTGAAGTIGVGRVVHSTPDGYTIGIGHLGTHVANGAIYKLNYDLIADLEPVVLLPSNPMIIVSKNAVPAKTLARVDKGETGAGHRRHGRRGLGQPHRRPCVGKRCRRQAAICAIPRHGTRDERSRRRPNRHYRRSTL